MTAWLQLIAQLIAAIPAIWNFIQQVLKLIKGGTLQSSVKQAFVDLQAVYQKADAAVIGLIHPSSKK